MELHLNVLFLTKHFFLLNTVLLQLFTPQPSEKMYRVQCPRDNTIFRPDLNFEGASDKEIEVNMHTHTKPTVYFKTHTR